jgi:hypothetical protein
MIFSIFTTSPLLRAKAPSGSTNTSKVLPWVFNLAIIDSSRVTIAIHSSDFFFLSLPLLSDACIFITCSTYFSTSEGASFLNFLFESSITPISMVEALKTPSVVL